MSKALINRIFQVPTLTTPASAAMLLLRVVGGVAMILHGWGKIQAPFSWMGPESPVPGIFQFLAALSEFGGGIAWIIGLVMPLASFGMLCTMVVATFMHAVINGDPFVGKGGPSYELALLYLCISVLFIAAGPGKFSVDGKVFGSRSED